MIKRLPWFLFAFGLVLGSVLFFPFHTLTSRIQAQIQRASNIDVQMGDLRLGTGLGLGLGRGGLAALRGTNVRIGLGNGQGLQCREFVLSPQLWALLVAKGRVTAACRTERDGSVVSVISVSPIWSPQKLRASLELEGLKLPLLESFVKLNGISGQLDGKVDIEMALVGKGGALPAVTWDARGTKVVLPAVESSFLNLPNIQVGKLATKGRLLPSGRTEIEDFSFGSADAPIEAKVTGSMTLDRHGMPSGADIQGSLRTNPDFEKVQLKDINLDLLFGTAKASGKREFRKLAQGSLTGLLLNPPLDRPSGAATK